MEEEPQEEKIKEEPPTLETVRAWIEQIKPAPVLALLKDPDIGPSVRSAFSGFRTDAKNYGFPSVRSRLAQAAVREPKLAEKLKALAALTEAPALPEPAPIQAPRHDPPRPAEPKPDQTDALRLERDQRRRERDEARQALALAQTERDEAVKARQKAETERDEAARQVKKQGERITRLERQTQKQKDIESSLIRALEQDKVSPPPTASPRAAGPVPGEAEEKISPWLTAVERWLDKGKYDQALALATEVLKTDPEDPSALEIAARAWEGRREQTQAVPYLRRLLAVQVARRGMEEAAGTLGRLLRLASDTPGMETDARLFLLALSATDELGVEAGRRMLARLRGSDPVAHGWLASYIAAQTPLGPVLMPPPGALGPDDALPLRLGPLQTVTARLIAEAVDQGNTALIESARPALLELETSDANTSGRVWAALEKASEDDPSRLIPLRRTPRGPVVVDGSNVAWFDQESLAQGKPRLRHLREMRRFLRTRGFFPVVLYADANLPHLIDEPGALRLMQNRREILLVDAETAADEVLLRTAKLLNAPLITNDKMEDWDPEREVLKARYTISSGGEAYLLTDI